MPAVRKHFDRPLFFITIALVTIGFFVFSSASLGLLVRSSISFSSIALPQLLLGVVGGMTALFIAARVPYRTYRVAAPHIFGAALVLTALVFVPGLGYEANGARRWLDVFGVSFQPAELLKVAFVLCLSWYYSVQYKKMDDMRYALGGLVACVGLSGAVLLLQPDTGTFAILVATGGAISVAAGMRIRHLLILGSIAILGLALLVLVRPYVLERVTTFLDPVGDPHGAGYQIKQSLIAVGSGGIVGRGFGQSVQKFNYLPEPIGDSIFSVAAEEFGFLGSLVIIGLFVGFAVRGLQIASRTPDRYGGLVVVGIVILIVTQSFINIASMVGLMPLTGEPLTFISKGGTSLMFALLSVGIVLNISRSMRPNPHTT